MKHIFNELYKELMNRDYKELFIAIFVLFGASLIIVAGWIALYLVVVDVIPYLWGLSLFGKALSMALSGVVLIIIGAILEEC